MNNIYHQRLAHRSEGTSGAPSETATDILIGAGVLESPEARAGIAPWLADRTLFILSSGPLRSLHGEALQGLTEAARHCVDLEVEDGEAAKSVAWAGRLWEQMLDAGGKRDSRLLAFGGGSIGDLGGFVAGCFLRGIEVVQVPTTLLAQVDAAIGGKTAVDLPGGKNTVGLFHHPKMVLSDTALLSTLPPAELRSGLVEVVKMAALLDPPLLDRVERDLPALLAADAEALGPVVSAASAAKARVVEDDFRESGRRRLLNFGHTLGHAIEVAVGYGTLRHGEAIAYGLLYACRLARGRSLGEEVGERLHSLLARFELPPLGQLDAEVLWRYMGRDKKATERGIAWVLPVAMGHGEVFEDVGRDEVMAELEKFLENPWG